MKALKTLFAASLLLLGLGFTSCNKDDDAQEPVNLPIEESPENPIAPVPTPFN
ncbi:hypothetical protein [Saccharicrinis aurantiacus]|uniref:hypothetical protein n=1 Tax=Saccharicrinis aurantiacus TaxID=1849719 RepID=UPI0015C57A9A|nr:hypothetical protein [Saccharicrinis aurantiacus]